MTKKSDDLWQQIYPTTNSPRKLLVAYVEELIKEAKLLTPGEREKRGDYSDQRYKFPQTKGEEIANAINYALLMQDWIESADELAEIAEIAGILERDTDNHELWQELFKKIDRLKD